MKNLLTASLVSLVFALNAHAGRPAPSPAPRPTTLAQNLTLEISGLNTNQEIVLKISPVSATDDQIGFDEIAQLTVNTSGPVIQSITVTPGTLDIVLGNPTSSGKSTITINIAVIASAGIDQFYLQNGSDVGVSISAALGDQQRAIVNKTLTLFPWVP